MDKGNNREEQRGRQMRGSSQESTDWRLDSTVSFERRYEYDKKLFLESFVMGQTNERTIYDCFALIRIYLEA